MVPSQVCCCPVVPVLAIGDTSRMCEPTTDELVRRAAEGDEVAFGQLMVRYKGRAEGRVRSWTWDLTAEDREDILQLFWVDVWDGLRGFRRESAFFTWAHPVLSRRTFRETRRVRSHQPPRGERGDGEPDGRLALLTADISAMDPLDALTDEETLGHFCVALRGLTPQQRAVYQRYWVGYAAGEIAEELGITRNNVDQAVYQARRAVKTGFERLGRATPDSHASIRGALRVCQDVFAYCRTMWGDADPCD